MFLDQCLGSRRVADSLRSAGVTVELLTDHFPNPAISDEDWLPVVGSRGWIVLTKDKRIRRRPLELAALMRGQVRAFAITAGEATGVAMAEAMLKALPRIRQFVRDFPAPFVATITTSGRVQMLMRAADIAHVTQKLGKQSRTIN